MLSGSAFNALLKTIEEPPDHAIFILATTEYNKVPSTIKSRCQIYNFKLINQDDIVLGLENVLAREGITYFEKDALEYVARKADGSMRDAISILDQCIAQHNGTQPTTISEVKQLFGDIEDDVIVELVDCIENVDVVRGLDILHDQHYNGRNIKLLLDALYHYYFNKFTTVFGTDEGIVFERYARILGETISALDHSSRKMTMAEIAFIKMCKPEMESDYNSVVQRMNNLENELTTIKSNGMSINVDKVDNVVDKQEKFDRSVTLYYNSPWNYLLRTQ
jgi:DNA polymerase-3 subunit gamma/tau